MQHEAHGKPATTKTGKMIQKAIDKHRECARHLEDYKKETNGDFKQLILEMYVNALHELLRAPIEAVYEASRDNAVPVADDNFKALTGIRPDEIQAFFSQPAIAAKN